MYYLDQCLLFAFAPAGSPEEWALRLPADSTTGQQSWGASRAPGQGLSTFPWRHPEGRQDSYNHRQMFMSSSFSPVTLEMVDSLGLCPLLTSPGETEDPELLLPRCTGSQREMHFGDCGPFR